MFVRCTDDTQERLTKGRIYKVIEISESILDSDLYRVIDDRGMLNGWYSTRFEPYKLQAGDIVKLNEDLDVNKSYDVCLVSNMVRYAGQESKILGVVDMFDDGFTYDIEVDNNSYSWTEDMFCEVISHKEKKVKEIKKEDNIFELFNM